VPNIYGCLRLSSDALLWTQGCSLCQMKYMERTIPHPKAPGGPEVTLFSLPLLHIQGNQLSVSTSFLGQVKASVLFLSASQIVSVTFKIHLLIFVLVPTVSFSLTWCKDHIFFILSFSPLLACWRLCLPSVL
jgi:hypothetical protein